MVVYVHHVTRGCIGTFATSATTGRGHLPGPALAACVVSDACFCVFSDSSGPAVLSSYPGRELQAATTTDPYVGHGIGPMPGYGVSYRLLV